MDAPSAEPHVHRHVQPDCPDCIVPPRMTRSAKFAWTIAGVALLLLVVVFFAGVGTPGATFAGFGGLAIVLILACPIVMGAMMWMMMRMNHKH